MQYDLATAAVNASLPVSMQAFEHALILLLLVAGLSVVGRWLPWPELITYLVGGVIAALVPVFPRLELDPGFFFRQCGARVFTGGSRRVRDGAHHWFRHWPAARSVDPASRERLVY